MEQFWRHVEHFWNCSRSLAWGLALSAVGLVLWASFRPQSPGVSIGLLALVAGIMSVRPKMHTAEKFAWVGILIAFAVLEVKAINRSDRENECKREQQNARFDVIAQGLQNSINLSRGQYDSTIKHVDGVLKKTDRIASLAEKSLNELTGGDSFAYVVPQTGLDSDRPGVHIAGFSMEMRVQGGQILSGVSVSVSRTDGISKSDEGVMHPQQIGTVSKDNRLMLDKYLVPIIQSDGMDHYLIKISAQNGFVLEFLDLRPSKNRDGWAYSYKVIGKPSFPIHDKRDEHLPNGNWDRILRKVEWTDPVDWRLSARQP